jgi:hypothetical protein
MRCFRCRDARFVCEAHPWAPVGHDAYDAPGMPCPACQEPGSRPLRLEDSVSSTLTARRLQRDARQIRCEIRNNDSVGRRLGCAVAR